MLIGLNENVNYKGLVFHIQTEDRGASKPVVVSTLFYQGMIILEEREDYSELFSADNREEKIKALKDELHQRVKDNLLKGRYDLRIKEYLKSIKKQKGQRPSEQDGKLKNFLTETIVPSLSESLGIELKKEELLEIIDRIPSINKQSEKERFLQLCSMVYSKISNRCSREDFKGLVKTWLTPARKPASLHEHRESFRTHLERIVLKDLEDAIGSSLSRALIDKVMEELHPMFFQKPEAFEIVIKRIINSGIVQKKTSNQWQRSAEESWRQRHRNILLAEDKSA
ncbi:MAG: hypothetical protein D6710_08630 [Nitrospirae bacterium]|nr:MAG: hypothetical protein D6710_08630 [Nitrospirota bacterium]